MSKNYVTSVIAIASAEVGYLEKKSNKDLDNKTANAGNNNYTKYGKWFGLNPAFWCAMFISWIFYKAYGTSEGKKVLGTYSASCETIRQKFIKDKRYYTSNPKLGDVVFFSGSRHSGANHIAIIYQVKDNKIYTIEGNTSGASGVVDNGGGVAKKSYSISNSRILGYGRPKYDKKPTKKAYSGTFPKGTLRKGSKGTEVKNLQKFLNWYGNYALEIDGSFGSATEKAVKAFQKANGLTVDGIFGTKSLAKAKSIKK